MLAESQGSLTMYGRRMGEETSEAAPSGMASALALSETVAGEAAAAVSSWPAAAEAEPAAAFSWLLAFVVFCFLEELPSSSPPFSAILDRLPNCGNSEGSRSAALDRVVTAGVGRLKGARPRRDWER